ncbi:MAG: putative TrmH family tRNA/rRNA methyltransferase [Chlamydiae bacterium]|nr:putative TrmH family tRNA/rRNA methyltransferase [Chlamydiota bacterium]
MFNMTKPDRFIMGKNCIAEVLKTSPDRIIEVFTCQKPGDILYDALLKNKVRLVEVSKKKLTQLVASESHQSYVAAVREREPLSVKEFLERSKNLDQSLVLMLDTIYDPQNLGTILRAAECFGVDLVIFSKNRGTDITPVTSKTSAGATELVPTCKVSNLAETMKAFQQTGYWAVAADVSEKTQPLYDFAFPEKTLLIMGSEGKGIQPILSKKCDFHVSIPMLGKIDSLNVSQATAVLLNSYRKHYS